MTQTPADQLRTAAAKLRPSSPPGAAHTVAVRLAPGIVDAAADLLDAAARMATAYPEMAHDHDRPACDDYACDLMGAALAVARQILGTTGEAAPSAPVGTDLRTRIADTLAKTDGWVWAPGFDKTGSPSYQGYLRQADAVLAVLPAPADRATVLREAATLLVDHASTLEAHSTSDYDKESFAANHLRTKAVDLCRLADEAAADAPCGRPASMTVPCSAGEWCCKGTGETQQFAPVVTEEPVVDTLAAWLNQRFDPRGANWEHLDEDDRSYWEHHARAVRRAVARGGFNGMDPHHITDDPAGCFDAKLARIAERARTTQEPAL